MQLGENYMVITETSACNESNHRCPIQGRVVYIHPRGCFAVLEFRGASGSFRESFFPEQLTEKTE